MTCTTCGVNLVDGARFCGECGTPVAEARPTPSAPQSTRARTPASFADTLAGNSSEVAAAALAAVASQVAATGAPPAAPAAPAPAAAPRPLNPNDLVGSTLNNRYRITARIGEGGFGMVYKGEQIAMGRDCAIKVLHGRMARDPQVVGRFRREAQAASVLKDPHTVQTYDFDQTPEGILYMAMELLHGRSLHTEMAQGPVPYQRVAHILCGVLDSLSEAHAQGIVHRDIKPENIYLETRGADSDYTKVLDFGIAKIVSGDGQNSGPQLTAAGQTLGTIEYMSPEQLMGQQLDGRSDLYAIGNLGYEMLVGALPFAHLRTPGELITAHLRTQPRAPSEMRPEMAISPAMDRVVLKLMEKQRDNRFKDAPEARAALQRILAGDAEAEVSTFRVAPEDMPTQKDLKPFQPPAGTEPPPSITEPRPTVGGGSVRYIVAGVVCLMVAVVAVWLLFMGKASGAAPPRPAVAPPLVSPAAMIPGHFDVLFVVDVGALRAAAPSGSLTPLFDAIRPQLAEIGATPESVGTVAVGVLGPGARVVEGHPVATSTVVVADVPVAAARFDAAAARQLRPGVKFVDATAGGIRYRKNPSGAYALLPGRIAVGSGRGFSAALGLARGGGTSLMAGKASALLALAGGGASRPAPSYGWAHLGDKERKQLDAYLPGIAAVEEIADTVRVGEAGADIKVVGACATPDGANQAAEAIRAGVLRARRAPVVALLGFSRMLEAVTVNTDGPMVNVNAHLTPVQLADLVARVGGAVSSMAQSAVGTAGQAGRAAIDARGGPGSAPRAGRDRK